MNTPRNYILPLLASIAASALGAVACGDPCLPTFTADTLIAPVFIDCEASAGSGAGDTSTSADITGGTGGTGGTGDTGDTSSTTADSSMPLDPKPGPLPVCIAIPAAGEEWGPCADGTCAAGLFCKVSGVGDVCLAACDVPGPCDTDKCLGGTCDMNIGACVAPCEAVGDPCPLPGMECFFGTPPLCAHKF